MYKVDKKVKVICRVCHCEYTRSEFVERFSSKYCCNQICLPPLPWPEIIEEMKI